MWGGGGGRGERGSRRISSKFSLMNEEGGEGEEEEEEEEEEMLTRDRQTDRKLTFFMYQLWENGHSLIFKASLLYKHTCTYDTDTIMTPQKIGITNRF